MKNKISILVVAVLAVNLIIPNAAFAADFDSGYIIGDKDLNDYNSMTQSEIQNFLENKDGGLDVYTAPNVNGVIESASAIIYGASQTYQINPKFLLALMQREQSLVEDYTPTAKQYDWAMGYGICDSCSMNDPSALIFKGFGSQVDHAAGSQRWFIDNTNNGWLKTSGKTYTIDGQKVTIQNQATANLYNYTPHILGNYNFWKIWNRWFSQLYPDGTLLQMEKDKAVWLIENGQRRLFKSMSVLMSRADPKQIITVSKNELEKYEIGKPIQFANYTLLKAPLGDSYMLVNDTLRPFESKEAIRAIGFNPQEFQSLSVENFNQYALGEPITSDSSYPAGALLQDKTTGGVYYVQDGSKYPLISRDILKINFPGRKITRVSPTELDKYALGESVKLKDGLIVRTPDSPSIYIISNGQKRPVPSGDVFERLGYKWTNVVVVQDVTLSNLEQGSFIDLDFKNQ